MERSQVYPGRFLFRDPARFGCAARFDEISRIDRADKAESRGVAKRNPFAAIAHGHELAEAIVDAIREPLLVLDPDLRVIAASRSFYRTFAVTPRKTEGRQLFELGDGQWNIPGLRILLEDVIPKRRTVEAYEVEHEFPSIGRRVMLLNARRVFDENGSASAILLAIEDVTRRRETEQEKDELLQQKEILLQEMQHRVANSLQIIASILLLKARTVQSEETRLHLQDAHQRVMSVATVQQQLQPSGLNESIEVGAYLSKLCASLAASMIGDRRPLAIKVQATSGRAVSAEAVSLGLIVTELVINALKHGFQGEEEGEILVRYNVQDTGWRLSVSDNGSGPQEAGGEPPHTGLGTSIVEALAHQLEATVKKTSGPQGTTVTIARRE
jgi:two-component sensor histidine kinase/PAS domain-containing protein